MKKIKIMITILSLSVMYQFATAQTPCSGNKVRMVKGAYRCGCHCQKKCVFPADTLTYKNNGWGVGDDCFGNCCWIRLADDISSAKTSLTGIYPNPVTGSATIFFSLTQTQKVSFKLFDMAGRLIATLADENFEEGENEIVWSSDNINGGIYFLQFQSEGNSETIKVAVTK